jgi:hypothetical protein
VLRSFRVRLIPQQISGQPSAVCLLGNDKFFGEGFTQLTPKGVEGFGWLDLRPDMIEQVLPRLMLMLNDAAAPVVQLVTQRMWFSVLEYFLMN